MRILVINPNTTAAMTETIAASARRVAVDPDSVTAVNPETGPAAIQGREDGENALPGLFALFDREMRGEAPHDGVVIACFDDTGLSHLRGQTTQPVIGIGEAGYLAAMLLAERFSVVTTLSVSVPVLEDNISSYGFSRRCANVRASGVPVLDLETDRAGAQTVIEQEVARAFDEDDIGAVVLGCAGMTALAHALTQIFQRPVIDGVAAAIGLCEAMHKLQLATSIDNATSAKARP
ncbi:MAG: aspartate/glutamate racemase family protein [Pseudomonadota bacterium]